MGNSKTTVAKTATHALKVLWEVGLFGFWKNKSSVVERLAKMGHHFSDAELGMALMRAKHLTRKGKRGSYMYIQKYPYVPEEKVIAKKKRA